jgi:hypothetical protein
MAILWCRKLGETRLSTTPEGDRQHSETYIVKSDSPTESLAAILSASELPAYGSSHTEDPEALCLVIDPQRIAKSPFLWRVNCTWTTSYGGSGGSTNPQEMRKSPDQRRPDWQYRFEPIDQFLQCDLDGNPFRDTAGTLFSPPPSQPIYCDHITITRYEPTTFSRAFDRQYLNATNVDAWDECEPMTALVHNIQRRTVWEHNAYWCQTTYEIIAKPRVYFANVGELGGFHPTKILNQGPKARDPATGKPRPVRELGYYSGQSVLLDADGYKLAEEATPVFLEFTTVQFATFRYLELVRPV